MPGVSGKHNDIGPIRPKVRFGAQIRPPAAGEEGCVFAHS